MFDPPIDRRLKDVPLPEGMLDRLRSISLTDEALDDQLNDVAIPQGMLARLREAVDDARTDEALADVPVPDTLLPKLQRISQLRRKRRMPPWVGAAAAACLVVLLTVSHLLLLGAMIGWVFPQSASPTVVQVEQPGVELTAYEAEPPVVAIALAAEPPATPDNDLLKRGSDRGPLTPVQLIDVESTPTAGPLQALLTDIDKGLRLQDDVVLMRWQLLGAALRAEDQLPPANVASSARGAATAVPLVAGMDRLFLWKHQTWPLVWPAANDELCKMSVPLSTETASFDLSSHFADEGRLPERDQVRIADFVASIDAGPPIPAAGEVSLDAALAPSPFGESLGETAAKAWQFGSRSLPRTIGPDLIRQPARLLQIVAQSGMTKSSDEPQRLVIALDVSQTMGRSGAIELVRQAVPKMLDRLRPQDRISLIAFNDHIVDRVQSASPSDREQILDLLQTIRPHGGADFRVGLTEALRASLEFSVHGSTSDAPQRIVLITDAEAGLSSEAASRLQRLLEELEAANVQLDAIVPQPGSLVDPALSMLASAGRGEVLPGASTRQMEKSLTQCLIASSPVAAGEVSLKIEFDPHQVAAYRMIGAEPTPLESLAPTAAEIDLQPGDSAMALFEIWLHDVGPHESGGRPSDVVATAMLSWRDPATGHLHRRKRPIRRSETASAWQMAPHSLQAASLAAEAAESLRGSPFSTSRGKSLAHVLQAAATADSGLSQRDDVSRLLRFVRQADVIRKRRSISDVRE